MIIQVIHLTEHDLTCARFKRTGREQLTPLSGFRFPYSSLKEISAILREQLPPLTETTSDDIRTILTLPPALITLREMPLPFTDRRKLRAVLPLELAGEAAQGDQELVCDALPLTDGTVLAGWATQDTVAGFIELLSEAGCEPEVISLSCLHWHLLIPNGLSGPVALVDPQAILVGQGNGTPSPLFCRGLGNDRADLARTLAAVELSKSLTVGTLFTLEAELPFDLPPDCLVQPLPLPDLLLPAPGGTLPATALAAPLATARAYCNGTIFNLRSGPLAWTRQRGLLLRRYRTPLILAAVALLLILAESGIRWLLLKRDLTSLNSSISTIYRQVFPARKKAVDETSEIKAEIRRLQGGISPQSTLAFLTLLATAKGDQVTALTEVDYDGDRFRIKGESRTSADINSFRQRLATAGWSVESPELTTRPDGTILFALKGHQGGTTQ